jgi:hypothetical protein
LIFYIYLKMEDLLANIYSLTNSKDLNNELYYHMIHERIQYLLEYEINQLFHVLYRIDIAEITVKKIFQDNADSSEISKQLTLEVIKRIKQKIELRNKYSSKS